MLTKWQRGLNWGAVCLENHDQPRIVSHYGDDVSYHERSAKLLATMQLTLRGTPFIYQGQEIGMTNFDFTSLSQLNDVESHGVDKLMRSLLIPAGVRWNWIKTASRDNSRTPMQWTAQQGAGFTNGKPWLGINGNHTDINYQDQQSRPDSILSYYRKMIALRKASDTLKYGDFSPVYSKAGVIAYSRHLGSDKYITILNFADKQAFVEPKLLLIPLPGHLSPAAAPKRPQPEPGPATTAIVGSKPCEVLISNTDRETFDGSLAPWEAIILRLQA